MNGYGGWILRSPQMDLSSKYVGRICNEPLFFHLYTYSGGLKLPGAVPNFNMHMNHLSVLLICRFWFSRDWDEACDSAFLTAFQMILLLQVCGQLQVWGSLSLVRPRILASFSLGPWPRYLETSSLNAPRQVLRSYIMEVATALTHYSLNEALAELLKPCHSSTNSLTTAYCTKFLLEFEEELSFLG